MKAIGSRVLAVGAAWLGSIVVASLVASSSQSATVVRPSRERAEITARSPAPSSSAPAGLTAADIRAAVRAELAAAAAASSASTTPDAVVVDDDDAAAPEGDDGAYLRADDELTSAMADGRWNDTERARFLDSLVELDQEQAESLLSTLALAINANQLAIDTAGAPI